MDRQMVAGRPAPAGRVLRYLDMRDIGAWFGVRAATVSAWRSRHADFPAPDVVLGGSPGWAPSRERTIRNWHRSRPGQGAGGGRPRRQPE